MHTTTSTNSFWRFILLPALFFITWQGTAQVKKAFTPRYNATVKGDVTMIANNMLSAHPTNSFNTPGVDNQDSDNRVFVDIDFDASTFNSSSANLINPEPSASCLEFTGAYLYWVASDKEAGGDTQNDDTWSHSNVKLMLPGSSSYSTLSADEVLYYGRPEHFYNDPYICVKDITSLVQGLASPYGKYQVANVKAAWGGLDIHNGGNVGVAGGWQIVFVYESNDLTRKNITLFDGYSHIANTQTTEFEVDGFLAVPTGAVNANLILGSIEGDNDLDQDNFQIKKPDGNWQKISTPLRDENNFFSSRITRDGVNFVDRNPASTNTLGYDASVFQLNNPGNSLIANGQTSTSFRAASGNETYGLYLVGFAIEVYEPSLGALEFTTSPLDSDYDPGEAATLSLSIENTGNDNVRNLEITTILPAEVEFDSTQPLPPGTTFTYNSGTRELVFNVEDGYTDAGDPQYNIDFDVLVNGQCYFLEGACEGQFEIQAEATYTGEINPATQTTNSSGTLDECGMGNHDPSIITINQPAQLGWGTPGNGLDITVECDDPSGLSAAQAMEPLPEDCTFTLNKISGPFVEDPSCDVIGTYTNVWTFTDGCGRTSGAFTQVITVEDNTAPTFNETLPADTTAAYDNIPAPETLTATDTCDTNPQVVFNESYIGDNTSTTYIIVRTWTATDCAGNQTEHTQKIFVTENGDPIGLAINDTSVDESAGTVVFTVSLTGEVTGGFTVDYFTVNGTAIAPGDFAAITTSQLAFTGTHGENHTISVTINDDSIVEENENYEVNLTNLSTTEITINDSIGNGTILDNDSASVAIGDLIVDEAVGTAQVEVVLSGNTEESFTVDFSTADGSAIAGSDYTALSGQVTFPTNSTNGAIEVINVPITDDNFIEQSEDFLVNLTGLSANGSITISDDQATVTINDNDNVGGVGVSFDATDVTVNEGDGTATFTVSLSGNVQGGFTLDYATADDSAEEPGDYTDTSGSLTFAGTDGESYDITVPVIDDNLIEATEDFFVNLDNLSTTLVTILTSQATGHIEDNDNVGGVGVSFDATDVTVNEGDGTATFTVSLSGNVQGGFTLDYATADDSAEEPGDYTDTSGSLTFAGTDGESYDITVPVIDDNLIEATEDFFVNLDNLSTTLVTILTSQATGHIEDNDNVGGVGVSFDATDVTVNEGDGTATFTVSLSGNVQGGFTLDYATADDSAEEPGDYTDTSGSLTFAGTDGESYDITVPVIDDNLIEATEDFFVNLDNLSTTLVTILTSQATGHIEDNDNVGGVGVSFDATDVTVNEGDGTATFTVSLSGNVQGGFTLDYATADDSAEEPGDYTDTSGSLTFAGTDGESYDITVPVIDDNLIEATEDFFVNLDNLSTTLVTILTSQATGHIEDNDNVGGVGVSFDATDVTVNEGDGTATFTVSLSGNVQGGFTLDYATADDSAEEPGDYTDTSGSLTFAGTDGESYDITVPVIDDNLIEATEDFFVNLDNLSTTLVTILTSQATGHIEDNDNVGGVGVSFDATDVTVNEGDGTATFTVSLSGNVQGGFTLDYATADDSAEEPGDYTDTSGSLTFAGTDGESYDITVPVIDDNLIEATEDFFVNLDNLSTTLVTILTSQATGHIEDNDNVGGVGVSFDATDVTVNEGDGTATFTVSLSGNVQGGFTLDYATADDSAEEPGDYTDTSGSLTFAGTDGESYDITVPVIDDNLIEATEDFFVNLDNLSTTLVTILTSQATGHIEDNDNVGGVGVSFDATDVTVNEGDGTATFTVSLSGNVQGGFTLDYATADDSAEEPGDYTDTSGSLTFAGTDGESYDITVPVIDDNLIEATEDFFVNLDNLSTTLVTILTSQATGHIEDNDNVGGVGVSFDATDVTVNEGDGTATFTVSLSGNVQGGFTLDYATADDSAEEPGDYTDTSGSLTFAGTDGESYDITVPVIDDNLIEATEDFFVNLDNLSTTLVTILTSQATGHIEDNDNVGGVGVSFDATDVTVNEGDGTATFTVSLSGNVQGGFTLDYATADDSAEEPGDYTDTSGSLTFAGTDGESYDITVPVIDDNLIEATEDFFVNLDNLSTTLVTILTSQATGHIEDNDNVGGVGVSFDATDVTVNEGDGTATFTVSLSGNVQGGFTLDYATADDSAEEPGDYTDTSGSLTFAGTDGESYDITVPVIDDNLIEATEDFFVNLDNLSTTLVTILTSQATGHIEDNDNVGGVGVSFDATDVTVNEGDGTATFTVSLSGNVQGGFTLDYATADDSAEEPGDYTDTSGSLTFAGTDGESYDITVPVIDDNLIEATEDFFVNLDNLSTTLVTILTSQATGHIEDNDNVGGVGVSFDATDVTVNEGDGTATFTVSLSGNVQGGFTLDYATADDSAEEPGDYTDTSGSLTFAGTDGESYDITVPVIDDNLIEATEDFFVNLDNLSTTLVTILTSQATGHIEDNDNVGGVGVSFDATDVTVNEGDGTATFTVSLSGNVQGGFTLDYATADDSAEEPGDYTDTSGSLTFAGTDGESYDITVPVIDDNLIEATEDFFVNLDNLSTTLVTILTSQATGHIEDNDNVGGVGVSFDATDVTVNEGDGTATFTVSLSGNVQGGFTLDYATADDSAEEPGDYTDTSGSLTFAGTDGESYDITVPVIDDNLIEATEDFFVNLDNLSTTLVTILTSQATGHIEDNDNVGGVGVSFDATDVTVNEGDGTATFTVSLSGNVQGGFTLDYATADDSAEEPGDYTDTSGSLTFAGTDGESYDITVPVIDDNLIEATEDFFVNLDNLSTTLVTILTSQATGHIEDNDNVGGVGVSFDATDVTVNEGDGTATFTVSLSGNVQGGFTLDYATADDSAEEPGDYTDTSGSLTFAGTDGESYDITVPVIDDNLIEATEDFFVNLDNLSTTLVTILTSQATGHIEDNDNVGGVGVSFDATDVTVNEGDGTATFTVSLSGNVQGGFTLDYATADDSAEEPGDYTDTSGSLTFAGTDGESYDITVPVIDDNLIEATEDFFVNLDNLSTTLVTILTSQATGHIEDNDNVGGVGVSFDATDVTVNEGDGTATFTVSLSGNVQGGFTLDYATADDSAEEPGDYTDTSGSLTFAGTDGESYDITVPVIDDNLIEATEDFFVNLDNLSTTLVTILTSQATGHIEDNDNVGGVGVSFDATDVTVNEGDGTATFTVSLSGNVQGGFTLDYATADDSAEEPGDYTDTSGSLTFAGTDGESYDITVPVIDDNLIEATEDFFVNLDNLSTTLVTILTSQATGHIEDNDNVGGVGVSFDATDVTVNEGDGTATFTVSLSGNVQGGFTLDYATADDSAEEPGDYTDTSGSLTFAGTDGESYDITVPIIDDVIVESTEGYVVDLLNLSTPLIPIITPQAVGTILDNDSTDDFPANTTVSCDDIPEVPEITLNANGCAYTEVFEEIITGQDDECATEYTITRTWTVTDCVDNTRIHVQTITVEDTIAPQFIEALPADATVSCDNVPDAVILTATDNCDADAFVTMEETFSGLGDDACPSVYMIVRTWTAEDCAGNTTVHTQTINVEDTDAPVFVEALPEDMTVMCNEIPDAAVLTALDNCDPNVQVVFDEFITNEANCAMGYTITRSWTASDCAGNMVDHTQVITIPATGPITASAYEEEITIICGDTIPEVPSLEFMGGCGTYDVVFNEEIDISESSDDYMIIRTWDVTDSCGNTASFEQIIFVMQPQLETVTIDICVEDDAIDLVNYLPEGFDTNGVFEVMSNNYTLVGSILNPLSLNLDNQTLIAYSSTDGTCKYFVDFVINANTDCVPCSRNDIVASRTITANGDGMNDYFEITGVEFCDFRFDVMIFNRWGAKVFEGQNYQNDWGGFSPSNAFGSSGMLPSGTYYYIIKITNKDFEPVTGYIYIGSN